MSSQVTCNNCGSNQTEFDSSRGDTYCMKCGFVIDQNCIVSEVLFAEGTHGGSHIIGQRHDTESAFKSFSIGGMLGAGRESRQVTLMNAKRRIKTVCDQLRLNDHFIDMAFNFYKMALNRRLTQGRKHIHVVAACIYITCRSEGTSHMLLDLSDVSQVNVYELGRTYLRLTAALCITIPAIDPSLYIIRFAQHLSLGEKSNTEVEKLRNNIISTANRLVQRMKRDWMHYGRRPSGLCGAAILVAARLNNVHCSIKDIIKVVKVCETTIRKRLCEFSETPTSNLTLDEFMTIDLESEEDPPCFKANKRKQKLSQLENEKNMEEIQTKISHLQKLIEIDLEKSRKKLRNPFAKYLTVDSNGSPTKDDSEESTVQQFLNETIVESTVETIKSVLTAEENYEQYMESIKSLRPTAATLGITDVIQRVEEKCEDKDDIKESDELDLTGIDDSELDGYLLTVDEIDAKTKVWTRVHKDFLEELKIKEELKAKEEEERKQKEASGELPPKKKRKTRKKTNIQANSASEAIEKMLQEKKISNKINYDVLKNLNPNFDQKTSIPPVFKIPEPVFKDDIPGPSEQKSPSLKRLPSLKNSANTSLINLKTSIYNKLRMKSMDSESAAIKAVDNMKQSEETNQLKQLKTTPNILNDSQETNVTNEELDDDEEEEDDDEEEEPKRQELSIQELLGLESGEQNFSDYDDDDY